MKSELQTKLDENIPDSAVHTRAQGGKDLSYLETWYVIDRLNQVLGQGNWAYSSEVTHVHTGKVTFQSGETNSVHYIARVRLVVTVDGQSTEFTDVGYGDGTDKNNPGKAHELAVKEAVSDGLKRCAKNLGRSMGLALYDKTQEFVGAVANKNSGISSSTNEEKQGSIGNGEQSGTAKSTAPSNNFPTKPISKPTKELITAAFKVLEAQKKITKEEFKAKYQGGKGLSTLTDWELNNIIKTVKQDFKL